MKINRLRLKGFIGIYKGLGLKELDLDFSDLAGLIALSGPNGSGKTTILDCLQPYRQMASRNRALQHHCYLANSEKVLEFEFNGANYKTLLKIDAESERSEGYIWKDGVSLVDGKVKNYDKVITGLFGSPTLFFNSVFCGQGSKKLNEMTTGDLKKLFSEFLRLDTLVEYENTAKQCNNLLSSKAEKLEREIKPLKELADIYGEAISRLQDAKTDKQRHEQSLAELTNDLKQAETKLADIQAIVQKNELINARITGLQDSLAVIEKDIYDNKKQSQTELTDLRSKYLTVDLEIVELQSLLANEAEIRKAADVCAEMTASIAENKKLLETISKEHLAAVQLTSKKETEKSEYSLSMGKRIGAGENNRDTLSLQIHQAKLKTADLDKRDRILAEANEPECKSNACPFITTALSAQKDIPELESKLADQNADLKILKKEYSDTLNRINAEIEALRKAESGKKSEKDRLEAKITESEDRLVKVKDLAGELSKVETALTRKNDLEKQKTELTDEGIKIKTTWEKRIAEKEDQKETTEKTIKLIEAEINKDAEHNLPVISNNIDLIKSSITDRANTITELSATILSLEKEVAQKEQAKKDFELKTKEQVRIVNESSEWAYLKNACSANGLRALEIDSVAPVISAYANDLLASTFGPLYTVKFRTQDEETGREILDIIVIREDGSEVLLDNLSGGQKVWGLKALRLAMTLIAKEKSGKNFLTALSDEEDGPLDVENAQNFIQLYRAFMGAGGFHDCFYISHKPSCVAMADHVLEFDNGSVKVN